MFYMQREFRELIQMVREYENMHGEAKKQQATKIAELLAQLRKKHFAHIV